MTTFAKLAPDSCPSTLAATRPAPASPPTDVQLLDCIAQGDLEAFGALYDRYATPLYSLAARMLKDANEAEDVLQEVFLQIWKKAASFNESAGQPFSWAVTMTRHKSIDRLRARQRRVQVFQEFADHAEVAATVEAIQPTENFRREQAGQIRSAVNELPQAQRQPIELAFYRGLTHMEIAEALAAPLGTIKARIRRGMGRLRDGLEGRIRSPKQQQNCSYETQSQP